MHLIEKNVINNIGGMILQYNVVGRYFRICNPIEVFGEVRILT